MFKQALAMALALGATGAHADTAQLGKVEFLAQTNIKMFQFKGEAGELKSKVERKGDALTALEIRIPVEALKTGMEIRDKHMRERIFTADDGSTPDIVFTSASASCQGDGKEKTCALNGELSFRGKTQPFTLSVTLTGDNQVTGHAVIDVLQFGVAEKALAWANVKVDPKTAIDFELRLQ
jgi:polyisoprenoid-binding protein YceI